MKTYRSHQLAAFPWHTFLLALFPVISLAAHNIDEINPSDPLRALILSLLLAAVLLLVSRLLLRDWRKAGAAASLAILLVFTYGHIYQFLEIHFPPIGHHRLLAPLFLVIFALLIWQLARSKSDLFSLTRALNLLAVTAVVIPLAQIALFSAGQRLTAGDQPSTQANSLPGTSSQAQPDIYYVILDAYSRDDVLRNLYGYDNSQFLSQLEEMGFYVARCSRSNYSSTRLSLPSVLNMDYLEKLMKFSPEDPYDRLRAAFLIKSSQVRRELEARGYQTVAFETGYPWTQIEDADFYISTRSNALGDVFVTGGLNRFEELLLRTTAGLLLVDGAKSLPDFIRPSIEYPNEAYRNVILNILSRMDELPAMPGPKFAFIHLGIPHDPFVFGPDGGKVSLDRQNHFTKEAYRDQVIYLNSRLIPILQRIISDSKTPPVIILQADHGGMETDPQQRMAILSAFYLPGGAKAQLYPSITPVNSLRLVLREVLGADYPPLEDISVFSKNLTPYKFIPVDEFRPECR